MEKESIESAREELERLNERKWDLLAELAMLELGKAALLSKLCTAESPN